MFAMNPQTIAMPEGVTPLASTTEPAGAAAAGTAFAEVVGPVSPPVGAGATPPAVPIILTLAEPVLTASLLAWPAQPSEATPSHATESPEADATLQVVDEGADASVASEVAVLATVVGFALLDMATPPPAAAVPAFPVERPTQTAMVSAASQGQAETHALDAVTPDRTAPSPVATAAQPVVQPADNAALWTGTTQTAPITPAHQQGPVAKASVTAVAAGIVTGPRNGPLPEKGSTIGAGDVAPRIPEQSAEQRPTPITGATDRPGPVTGHGAVVQPILHHTPRPESPTIKVPPDGLTRGARATATSGTQIAPVQAGPVQAGPGQTASQPPDPAYGPLPLARAAAAAQLGGAGRQLHAATAEVQAPRRAPLTGESTVADAPEVHLSGAKGQIPQTPVNNEPYPSTAHRQSETATGPISIKAGVTQPAAPLADVLTLDQTPAVLGAAKVQPGTVRIHPDRLMAEPTQPAIDDSAAVKPNDIPRAHANSARPTGEGRPSQNPAPVVTHTFVAAKAARPSVTGPWTPPTNAPLSNAEQVAPAVVQPRGRAVSTQPVQGQPAPDKGQPGTTVTAVPAPLQAVQETAQPVPTRQPDRQVTVAPRRDLPIAPHPEPGLSRAVAPALGQPTDQVEGDQPVPRPTGPRQPDHAAPRQDIQKQVQPASVQTLPERVLGNRPIPDPVGSGDKPKGLPAATPVASDRMTSIAPIHVAAARERPVWFGDRAAQTVPAGQPAPIEPPQVRTAVKPVGRTPAPIPDEVIEPDRARQIAPVTQAVRAAVPDTPHVSVQKAKVMPIPPASSPAGPLPASAPKTAGRADTVAIPSAEPIPQPMPEPSRPGLPRSDTPVAQVFATLAMDNPAARAAPPPTKAQSVTVKDQPQPTTLPYLDRPQLDRAAPQPSIASFWQAPTAEHSWQTALQYWTPAPPPSKPPTRSAVPTSQSPAKESTVLDQIDLAAPLKTGKSLRVDDRPRPGAATDRVERDRDATQVPTPVLVPAAVPAPGPAIIAQSGLADRPVTEGDSGLPLLSTTAPANLPAPLNVPPHLPKGLPESLARAAKEERTELLLDPVELGKVRFELLTTGDKVQVNLSVERPETLDLLRRNMDSLSREFREAGFDASTLSFSQWGKGQDDGQQQAAQTPQFGDEADLPVSVTTPIAKPTRNTASQGLDLRL